MIMGFWFEFSILSTEYWVLMIEYSLLASSSCLSHRQFCETVEQCHIIKSTGLYMPLAILLFAVYYKQTHTWCTALYSEKRHL